MAEKSIVADGGANVVAPFDSDGTISEMRAAVKRFAEEQILPLDASSSEKGEFPAHLWRKMGDQGFLGITAPARYGGLEMGYLAHLAVTEEISRCSGSVGLSYIAHSNLCVNQITLNGTEAQQAEFLPKLISGESVGALAISEANAGSDVMSMRTRAEKVDGGYALTGTKLWITNGRSANVVVVYAKTDVENKKITAFLVPTDTEGFRPGQKLHKIGMRASETYELVLDGVFVPDSYVLGQVDAGAEVLMSGLNYERLILAGGALGLAGAAFDESLNYTQERHQFARPISSNQAIAFDLAQMAADLDRERAFAYCAASLVDACGPDKKKDKSLNRLCAEVFLTAAQTADRISSRAVELHGGNGYTTEYRVGRIWNDTKLYMIGGGTSDIRKLVIARELGLRLGR
jgi:isovaleryl-CoA dehydrogenase